MINLLYKVLSAIHLNIKLNTNDRISDHVSLSIKQSYSLQQIYICDGLLGLSSDNLLVDLKTNPFLTISSIFLKFYQTKKVSAGDAKLAVFILGDSRLFILGFCLVTLHMFVVTYYGVWVWGQKTTETHFFNIEIPNNQLVKTFNSNMLLPSIFVSEETINDLTQILEIEPRIIIATLIFQRRRLEKYTFLVTKVLCEPILRLGFAPGYYSLLMYKLFPFILNGLQLNYQETLTFLLCVTLFLVFSYLYVVIIQWCLKLLLEYNKSAILIYLLTLKEKLKYLNYKYLLKYYQNIYQNILIMNLYDLLIYFFTNYYYGLIRYYSRLYKFFIAFSPV